MKKKTVTASDVCPDCGGTGYVLSDAGASPCACQKEMELDQAYQVARIPRKFLAKSLKTFQVGKKELKPVLDEARHFLAAFTKRAPMETCKGLVLFGKEGTGKTHIAIALLKEALAHGYTGLYWNVPDFFIELRRVMSNESQRTEGELIDEARRVDLLILDDLGAERSSEYVIECLYVLINGRYQQDKVTIITTNRTMEELRSQLSPRIASRIMEMCSIVRFPDGDFRRERLH